MNKEISAVRRVIVTASKFEKIQSGNKGRNLGVWIRKKPCNTPFKFPQCFYQTLSLSLPLCLYIYSPRVSISFLKINPSLTICVDFLLLIPLVFLCFIPLSLLLGFCCLFCLVGIWGFCGFFSSRSGVFVFWLLGFLRPIFECGWVCSEDLRGLIGGRRRRWRKIIQRRYLNVHLFCVLFWCSISRYWMN